MPMSVPRIFHAPPPASQPTLRHAPYASTAERAPRCALIPVVPGALELAPVRWPAPADTCADLTRQAAGAPLGERIVVAGRVTDEAGAPVAGALIELWQANAAGRYRHGHDAHAAPLDPNFVGAGRVCTDANGAYRFVSIRPGAYPWRNHPNAWRPAHLHFSVFGDCALARLVTQMYFPGDPLLAFDPIFNSIPDEAARARLVAAFDWSLTVPDTALGYRFDIVLGGRRATPADPS